MENHLKTCNHYNTEQTEVVLSLESTESRVDAFQDSAERQLLWIPYPSLSTTVLGKYTKICVSVTAIVKFREDSCCAHSEYRTVRASHLCAAT